MYFGKYASAGAINGACEEQELGKEAVLCPRCQHGLGGGGAAPCQWLVPGDEQGTWGRILSSCWASCGSRGMSWVYPAAFVPWVRRERGAYLDGFNIGGLY